MSGKKFDERVIPAIQQLRQALAAIERAKRNDYPPHVSACMTSASDHAAHAKVLIERASP